MISNVVELTHMGKLNKYVAVFPWRWNAIIDTRYIELFPKDCEELRQEKLLVIRDKLLGDCYERYFGLEEGNEVLLNAPTWQIIRFDW